MSDDYFRDKAVLVLFDNIADWGLFRYFVRNFDELGLKRVVYCFHVPGGVGHAAEYDGNMVQYLLLLGDGGLASPECQELISQADIIIKANGGARSDASPAPNAEFHSGM